MIVMIRAMNTDGRPMPQIGWSFYGADTLEVANRIQGQTPFTATTPLPVYMSSVLQTVEGAKTTPLPDSLPQAATEFLTRLADKGFAVFLPDEKPTGYPQRFMELMTAIRRSGAFDVLDRRSIIKFAHAIGFSEVADWIKANPRKFAEYALGGRIRFIDESTEQRLEERQCVAK